MILQAIKSVNFFLSMDFFQGTSPLSSEHKTKQKRPPAPFANPRNQSTNNPTTPDLKFPSGESIKQKA